MTNIFDDKKLKCIKEKSKSKIMIINIKTKGRIFFLEITTFYNEF